MIMIITRALAVRTTTRIMASGRKGIVKNRSVIRISS